MISTVLLFIGLRYSERRRHVLKASEDVLLLEASLDDLGEASVLLVTSFFGERNPSFLAVAAHYCWKLPSTICQKRPCCS